MIIGFTLFALLALTLGALAAVAVRRYRRSGIEMDMAAFFKRLIKASGFAEISPPQLGSRLDSDPAGPLVIDLRAADKYRRGHIPGAVSHPFDEFLRDLVVAGAYGDDKAREIVLVCDTGHMSRVAGAIMAEDEGFSSVYNLRGGMQRWARWEKSTERLPRWRPVAALVTCCR